MAKKDVESIVSGSRFSAKFVAEFMKECRRLRLTSQEIYEAMKTDSVFIHGFARECAERVARTIRKFSLKYLELVRTGIEITTSVFDKSRFTKGLMKYHVWPNFQNWILDKTPDQIPVFHGTLAKFKLTRDMSDAEIGEEIGGGTFSTSEVLTIIAALTDRQPNGEDGDLSTNGCCANIFYVKLEDGRVVAVFVGWHAGSREWVLDAYGLGNGRWFAGSCVFPRG